MTSLTLAIVLVFITGYLCIALESLTKVNKAPVALLMCVACWTLFMFKFGGIEHQKRQCCGGGQERQYHCLVLAPMVRARLRARPHPRGQPQRLSHL